MTAGGRLRAAALGAPALLLAGVLAGCDAGDDRSESGAGTPLLEVWTPETGTRLALIERRVRQFDEAHPQVEVNLTVRDFGSYPAQLKLALASDSAPDVFIGNLGWSLDGPLVKAGLLRPLDPWMARFGWDKRLPEVAQRQMRFTADGRHFGRGSLYGMPYAADVIGWFYNVRKLAALGVGVPATLGELEAAFDAAHRAGEVPIMLGNQPQWPGVHLYYLVSTQLASDREINGIVFGDRSVTWTAPSFVDSARRVARWNARGYLVPGANSLAPAEALARFAHGTGVFLPAGSWNAAELAVAMGDDVAFFLTPPSQPGGAQRATGSVGYGWHIAASSRQPELAAEFIDFMTDDAFARELEAGGDLSPLEPASPAPEASSRLAGQIAASWRNLLAQGALMPYLDFSTPNGAEVLFPTIQSILAGQVNAEQGLARVEEARRAFLDAP